MHFTDSLRNDLETNYYQVLDLDHSDFFVEKISTTETANSFWECMAYCSVGCDFFVHETTKCHLGSVAQATGTASLELSSGWDLHFKKTSYPGLESSHVLIPSRLTPTTMDNWCFYVYKVRTHVCPNRYVIILL